MKFLLLTLLSASSVLQFVEAGCKTYWEGTAPFCNSSCPKGCVGTGEYSKNGDGGHCFTGMKQKCRCCGPTIPDAGVCPATMTKTKCVLFVLICQNYYKKLPENVDVVCNSYACGACGGFGISSANPALNNDEVQTDSVSTTIVASDSSVPTTIAEIGNGTVAKTTSW